jgi:hypothetical protein
MWWVDNYMYDSFNLVPPIYGRAALSCMAWSGEWTPGREVASIPVLIPSETQNWLVPQLLIDPVLGHQFSAIVKFSTCSLIN